MIFLNDKLIIAGIGYHSGGCQHSPENDERLCSGIVLVLSTTLITGENSDGPSPMMYKHNGQPKTETQSIQPDDCFFSALSFLDAKGQLPFILVQQDDLVATCSLFCFTTNP